MRYGHHPTHTARVLRSLSVTLLGHQRLNIMVREEAGASA